jgi:alpha-D-ribose 1-methylphosphonate 5-phosphate C-P lyase
VSQGTPQYPCGNSNYPRRQIEKVIENHAKASKNSDLDRAFYRPVSGLFFVFSITDHATLLKIKHRKIPEKSSIPALFAF